MSRRFPCCGPGCPVCRPLRTVDRWREDWDRAARDLDPVPWFKRRKRARQDEATRRSREQLRQLFDEVERARREDDPTVN